MKVAAPISRLTLGDGISIWLQPFHWPGTTGCVWVNCFHSRLTLTAGRIGLYPENAGTEVSIWLTCGKCGPRSLCPTSQWRFTVQETIGQANLDSELLGFVVERRNSH